MRINKIMAQSVKILPLLLAFSCTAVEKVDSATLTEANSGQNQLVSYQQTNFQSPLMDSSSMFTERDLTQTVSLQKASVLNLTSRKDTIITKEGIYLLSGDYTETIVIVDAGDEAKVQLILNGLTIKNSDAPAIQVKTADKVFVTTTDSVNTLTVNGTFASSGTEHLDAVVFSRSDLTFNGMGTLNILSTAGNGITSKDDLKITGGELILQSALDGLEANDSIRIFDGNITIQSGKDALHSENSDDPLLGYVYIRGGTLNLSAGDDGIQGNSIVQIDGGDISILRSQEGVEGNQIQINRGTLEIQASDDGINAAAKSTLNVVLIVNGGDISVTMASGDTDAFDSNGDLYIYGGNIDVTARSSFDADRTAQLSGGSVTVNGTVVTELPSSMGGGRTGGRGRHW